MKIGIFGGAFNPPHKMHKDIAIELLTKGYLNKVIYVPTGNNYNKPCLLDGKDRVNMLKSMFSQNENQIEVSDFEVKGSLYTINTLNYFKNIYPTDEIYFICGTDNLAEFHTWHRYEEILKNYKLLVIARNGNVFDDLIKKYSEYTQSIVLAPIEMNLISSTMVRQEIINNGFTEELEQYLEKDVIEYLKTLQLKEVWK